MLYTTTSVWIGLELYEGAKIDPIQKFDFFFVVFDFSVCVFLVS